MVIIHKNSQTIYIPSIYLLFNLSRFAMGEAILQNIELNIFLYFQKIGFIFLAEKIAKEKNVNNYFGLLIFRRVIGSLYK
jgi:hypothetical protein